MITFLPFEDFELSAIVLDYKRLGKQRIEAKAILNVLDNPESKLNKHVAFRMWKEYKTALIVYGIIMCKQWIYRGYSDTTLEWFNTKLDSGIIPTLEYLKEHNLQPHWLGDERVHQSHRSRLIQKEPTYYKNVLGWNEPVMQYYWPV